MKQESISLFGLLHVAALWLQRKWELIVLFSVQCFLPDPHTNCSILLSKFATFACYIKLMTIRDVTSSVALELKKDTLKNLGLHI